MNGWWAWFSTSDPAGANNDIIQLTLDWNSFVSQFDLGFDLGVADGVCIYFNKLLLIILGISFFS